MKIIIAFALFVLVTFAILPTFDVVAAPAKSGQSIKLIRPDEGRFLVLGKEAMMTFKNDINPNDPRDISLSVVTHPAGRGGVPLHTNPPEYFYVMSGEFEFYGSRPDDLLRVNAGDIIQVESDTPHGYKHIGAGTGEMLVVTAPNWLEEYFDEFGTPTKEKVIPANAKELSMEKSIAAGRRHEINYLDK